LEVFGEFLNIFNVDNVNGRNSNVTVDSGANNIAPIPADDEFPITSGRQNLQFQLGVKFLF